MREDIEAELLKGLRSLQEWETRQAERRSAELDGIKSAVANLTTQVQLLTTKIEANHTLTQERIAGLAARVDKLEHDAEDTGVHNLNELREKAKFWPELLRAVAIGVLSMVIGGGVMYFATHGSSTEAPHAATAAH